MLDSLNLSHPLSAWFRRPNTPASFPVGKRSPPGHLGRLSTHHNHIVHNGSHPRPTPCPGRAVRPIFSPRARRCIRYRFPLTLHLGCLFCHSHHHIHEISSHFQKLRRCPRPLWKLAPGSHSPKILSPSSITISHRESSSYLRGTNPSSKIIFTTIWAAFPTTSVHLSS